MEFESLGDSICNLISYDNLLCVVTFKKNNEYTYTHYITQLVTN